MKDTAPPTALLEEEIGEMVSRKAMSQSYESNVEITSVMVLLSLISQAREEKEQGPLNVFRLSPLLQRKISKKPLSLCYSVKEAPASPFSQQGGCYENEGL